MGGGHRCPWGRSIRTTAMEVSAFYYRVLPARIVIGLCNSLLTDLQHTGGPKVPVSW